MRELAADARRGRLWLLRVAWIASLAGTVWFSAVFGSALRHSGFRGNQAVLGKTTFLMLGFLQCVILLLLTGSQLGAALAVERKEQTLGLLLSTDLTPWDIALGKWLRSMAHTVLLLAASTPVLSGILAFGGVAAGLILNTLANIMLLCGLLGACSLRFSASIKHHEQAFSLALGCLFLFTVVTILIAGLISQIFTDNDNKDLGNSVLAFNPFVFLACGENIGGQLGFVMAWLARAVYAGLTWLLLAWTASYLRRVDLAEIAVEKRAWRKQTFSTRTKFYKSLLQPFWVDRWTSNPVLRLTARQAYSQLRVRLCVIIFSVIYSVALVVFCLDNGPWAESGLSALLVDSLASGLLVCTYAFWLLIGLTIIYWATRMMVEERDGGALAMLCATGLSDWEIVKGKWGGLLAALAPLMLVVAGGQTLLVAFAPAASYEMAGFHYTNLLVGFDQILSCVWLCALACFCGAKARNAHSANLAAFVLGYLVISFGLRLLKLPLMLAQTFVGVISASYQPVLGSALNLLGEISFSVISAGVLLTLFLTLFHHSLRAAVARSWR